jgi:hypothetical protein
VIDLSTEHECFMMDTVLICLVIYAYTTKFLVSVHTVYLSFPRNEIRYVALLLLHHRNVNTNSVNIVRGCIQKFPD